MNPTQKQFSLNRGASRKQIPISNTLIRQHLGWEPGTRLRDGMEKTYRWIYDEMTRKA